MWPFAAFFAGVAETKQMGAVVDPAPLAAAGQSAARLEVWEQRRVIKTERLFCDLLTQVPPPRFRQTQPGRSATKEKKHVRSGKARAQCVVKRAAAALGKPPVHTRVKGRRVQFQSKTSVAAGQLLPGGTTRRPADGGGA